MRFTPRAAGLAVVAGLTATLLMLRPGDPPALAAQPPAAADLDLALVPADAVGFIHVRAADLWKNEAFAEIRKTFEKAGPKALANLDAQFVPKISTFDRVTAFLLMGEDKRPLPYIVLRFSAAFDPAQVAEAYLPGAQKTAAGTGVAYGSREGDTALYFPDNKHIVVCPREALKVLLTRPAAKSGAMSHGLKLAAAGRPVVGAVNLAAFPIPPRELEQLPPEVLPLLKAEHITGSLEVAGTVKVEAVAGFKDAAAAQDAEKAIKALAEHARKELGKLRADVEKRMFNPEVKGPRAAGDLPEAVFSVFALGALNQLDELLADPGAYVKRSGADLTASVTVPKELIVAAPVVVAVGAALLLPAVQKVRGAADRMKSFNNLKQIGLAIHNYHDVNGHFPRDITDKNGKPLLSWRVAILPYIEQENVYRQFKLDEPWDSENNKKASAVMIKTYLSPQVPLPPGAAGAPGLTHYQGFAGPGTAFEPGAKLRFADFTDGLSNTIMVVETAELVPWAKPGDIPFDPKKPLPKLAGAGGPDTIGALLGDGSVRALSLKTLTEKTLKDAITRNDGNPLGNDW